MKKTLLSVLLATCPLWPSAALAADGSPSSSSPTLMVAEHNALLRRGATDSYQIVESISAGQQVKVIDKFQNVAGETWYRIEYKGITGWARADDFSEAHVSSAFPNVMFAKQDSLLRRGATDSYRSVGSIPAGQQVKVIDEFQNAYGETWYRIEYGGVTGWTRADSFSNQPPSMLVGKRAVIAANDIAMRKGASPYYPVVKTLSNGDVVSIIAEFTNSLGEQYVRVEWAGVKGWVKTEQIYIPKQLPTLLPTFMNVVQSSPVRRGASVHYRAVATVSRGQSVKVIDLFVTNGQELWCRVDLGHVRGWVSEKVLTMSSTMSVPSGVSDTSSVSGQPLTVSVSVANVRQAPSLKAKVVTQLKKGTKLNSLSSAKDASGALWYKVSLNGKTLGWVHRTVVTKSYLSPPASQGMQKQVTTANAALFAEPSLSAAVIERIAKNRTVTVLKTTEASPFDWVQVTSASGKTGWMPVFEVKAPSYVYVKQAGTPLRRGASSNYQSLKALAANERLAVLYEYHGWLNVETSNGVRGWVEESSTSTVALNSLVEPTFSTINEDAYLTWKKTSNFRVSYSLLPGNRLKITGSFSYAEVPSTDIPGIQTVEWNGSSLLITFEPGYTFTLRHYSDRLALKILETGLKGKKIIIDAGHGAHDTGAIGPGGTREKDITLDTALLLKEELERAGAIVKLTRSTDIFLELSERTWIANSSDYDAFISIHADSYSRTSRGTTTYYNVSSNFNGPKSEQLAAIVQKHLVQQLGTYDRGHKTQDFYVNRKNELPSILVELAFISNPNEEALLKTKAFRQKAAVGIREGLEEYFSQF
ncbi:SH3 domain-containing protein [Geobacillus stearothermophilus]|nr:SH3 domain-containing protein [Geobacillus stearothermophilus]